MTSSDSHQMIEDAMLSEQRKADLRKQRDDAYNYGHDMGLRAAANYLSWPQIDAIATAPAGSERAAVKTQIRHLAGHMPTGGTMTAGFVAGVRDVYATVMAPAS